MEETEVSRIETGISLLDKIRFQISEIKQQVAMVNLLKRKLKRKLKDEN